MLQVRTIAVTIGLFIAALALPAAAETPPADATGPLADAGSPYLRQHAGDKVKWMLWGKEAFDRAAREDKPIFLSIGYSTCHWCHVMQRESFTDEATAELINQNFIPVLVDREQRPDVDETYALATQIISGAGGWPTNVFLTPDRKPFYATVYMPRDVLQQTLIAAFGEWKLNRAELVKGATELSGIITQFLNRREEAVQVTPALLGQATAGVVAKFDPEFGGVQGGAKFMRPSLLLFLLRQAAVHDSGIALGAVETTLKGMLNGAVWDHVGGGMHRYTEDREWRVPHFEKMLYDQALMVRVMLDTYRLTGDARYAKAVRRTLDFVLARMTGPEGEFYSAIDADTGEEEGTYYVWSAEEFKRLAGEGDAGFAEQVFAVTAKGNFNGSNVIYLKDQPQALADALKISKSELEERMDAVFSKLAEVRAKRTEPATDRKIITSWNALMVQALSAAASELGDETYHAAARRAGAFLWSEMRAPEGGFRRSLYRGRLDGTGTLQDHAFAALAFIALFDLTGEDVWIDRAEQTVGHVAKTFLDSDAGDYYMTAGDIAFGRTKLRNDGDMPSGNAVMLEVLARLSKRTLEPEYLLQAEALLAAVSGIALGDPVSYAYTLLAADQLLRGERGARQYLAKGRVRATAAYVEDTGELKVVLKVAPGWHINSNKPLEKDFIATELTVPATMSKGEVAYPKAIERRFSFNEKPLAVYEGEVEITVPVAPDLAPVELTVQACSDEVCLLPETVTFDLATGKLAAAAANPVQ